YAAKSGWTDIFIYPPYEFQAVDGLLTNFHLPKSTLIMLISAFAGRELIMDAYAEAIDKRYRFFSFGDRSEEHTSELQSRFDLVALHSFPTRRSSDLLCC